MSRVEENKNLIDYLTKSANENDKGVYEEVVAWHLGTINSLLADVSKSLAVIADNMPSPLEEE